MDEQATDGATADGAAEAAMTDAPVDDMVEIEHGEVTWRFDREFLDSNWTCIFGSGCKGILETPAEALGQGCCSVGAHFGDDPAGRDEAMTVSAYAAMLAPDQFQYHAAATADGGGIFGDHTRTHTRVVDGACIFLNRPGFAGGEGCALHIAALAASDSPIEWKPSVCWQLPLHVEWQEVDEHREIATVRRWDRTAWGELGATMAWCCTERDDGGEAYRGEQRVVDSMRESICALAGDTVWVELRRRLDGE